MANFVDSLNLTSETNLYEEIIFPCFPAAADGPIADYS